MVKYVPKGKCLSFSEEWLTVRTIKLLFIFNDVFLFGGFNNFKIYCTYFLNKLTFAIDINLLAVSLLIDYTIMWNNKNFISFLIILIKHYLLALNSCFFTEFPFFPR